MREALRSFLNGRRLLIAVASPIEAKAILTPLGVSTPPGPWMLTRIPGVEAVDWIVTGIGKSNAAAAVGRFLDPQAHGAALSVGIAGSLGPPEQRPALGATVLATGAVFADEGLEIPSGFMDCAAMGFPLADFPGSVVPVSAGLAAALAPLATESAYIATVSTCSGTDALAKQVTERTKARAEAMEGAAVCLAAFRLGVPAGELRVISNTTGDRPGQQWKIADALRRLGEVIGHAVR